jgi:hypothetical protein
MFLHVSEPQLQPSKRGKKPTVGRRKLPIQDYNPTNCTLGARHETCVIVPVPGSGIGDGEFRCPRRPETDSRASGVAAHAQVLEEPLIRPQSRKLDPAKIHGEAEELAKLAATVPNDIDQVAQGKLPRDLGEKLKRIEKLSKNLRSDLSL